MSIEPEIPKVQIKFWTLLHDQDPTGTTVYSAKASIEWASSVEMPMGSEDIKKAEILLQIAFENHILNIAKAILKKRGIDLDYTISQLSEIMELIKGFREPRKKPTMSLAEIRRRIEEGNKHFKKAWDLLDEIVSGG